jgi:TRAP-type C4-dicarboxylate transport system substrate-binding protein
MPAMVRNHDQARRWPQAEIGRRVEQMTEENGVKILTWVWNAGAIGSKEDNPIVAPEDVRRGTVTRAAGTRVEQMLESVGFGLSSMPSSDIYNGMQTGVLDSAVTSTSSFSSFRLYEQVKSYTSPSGGNTFWFILSPLIVGMKQFQRLTADQQRIFEEVGRELQQFAYDTAEQDDIRVEEEFRKAGVNVVRMDNAAFERWREMSEPIWADFARDVPNGQELIDLAKQVSAQ